MVSLYLTRRIKNLLIIGVVFVSLVFALKLSNFMEVVRKPSNDMGSSPEKAEKLFNDFNYDTKLKLKFVSKDIQEIKNNVNKILSNNNLNVLYSIRTGSNITKLVELPSKNYKELLSPIMNLPSLVSDELIKSPESVSIEGLKRRLQIAEKKRQEIQERIANSRTYDVRLMNAQKKLDETIDALSKELEEKEERENYILAKIDISNVVLKGDIVKSSFRTFIGTFFLSIIVISVALVIIYFFIVGFTKLFAILGIKTRHGSSKYGSYASGKYGYGRYYSGYGGEKRIKRKYIRRPAHKEKDSESPKTNNESNSNGNN
ncbi:MAG: hypothetical protein ISS28_00475 [Candidatus Cloacimonetes bacterium]|nr:hypothetical protein [Candidatus Cloacimonadota bacterium]MBL7085562.1 hypothetical protein [Candidatus Cloacimonadota bacterium]